MADILLAELSGQTFLVRGEDLIDDLLATGGTAGAAASLVEKLGGKIVEAGFLIELQFLHGRSKLGKFPIRSLVTY